MKTKSSLKPFALITAFFIVLCSSCTFSHSIPENPQKVASPQMDGEEWANVKSPSSPLRGWEFLASKLKQQGIEEETIRSIFADENLPLWTPISFKVRPQEPFSMYQKSNTPQARKNALEFYKQNKADFIRSSKKLPVEPEIILSILQIETRCGQNTGNQPIFYWLGRLVSTGFPPNILYNVKNSKEEPAPTYKELEERAEWLEEEFMPHLVSLVQLSQNLSVSPLSIKGSYGGALGLPQFLPGNIEKYGYDGDDDGAINLFVPADAIFSIANFLQSHGWKKGMTRAQKKSVILHYNRSNAYAETILTMAATLKKSM